MTEKRQMARRIFEYTQELNDLKKKHKEQGRALFHMEESINELRYLFVRRYGCYPETVRLERTCGYCGKEFIEAPGQTARTECPYCGRIQTGENETIKQEEQQ